MLSFLNLTAKFALIKGFPVMYEDWHGMAVIAWNVHWVSDRWRRCFNGMARLSVGFTGFPVHIEMILREWCVKRLLA